MLEIVNGLGSKSTNEHTRVVRRALERFHDVPGVQDVLSAEQSFPSADPCGLSS